MAQNEQHPGWGGSRGGGRPVTDRNVAVTTPITHYKMLYAMDGTRKAIAHTVYNMLEDRDILEDENVKALVDKMMELAA